MKWLFGDSPGARAVRLAVTAGLAALGANVPQVAGVAALVGRLFASF